MQYRKDLRSNNELSILGFGCMRLPINTKAGADLGKAEQLICDAIERGINYFDTAYIYGNSEKILGAALQKSGKREEIFIATKLPHNICRSEADFDRYFNEQLKRLQTDYIDYYLLHNVSTLEAFERLLSIGLAEWVAKQKAAGKIGQIGFSFHGAQNEFLELLDAYEWDFCQIQYNYMDENFQAGKAGLQKAHAQGLSVIIMEPLLGGKLAAGLPRKAEQLLKQADSAKTPVAWALQWLWNQPEVTVVLSGMGASRQLDENVELANNAKVGMLSPAELTTIASVIDVFKSAYKVDCTGCNYCMPCPQGINIPGCFAAYNARFVTGYISAITLFLTSINTSSKGMKAGPAGCVECGACEKQCPQHIPIMTELKAVKKTLQPFFLDAGFRLYKKISGQGPKEPEAD